MQKLILIRCAMRGQLVFLVGVAGGIAHATFAFKNVRTHVCVVVVIVE